MNGDGRPNYVPGDEGADIMKAAMVVLKLALNHEMTKFIRDPSMTEPDNSKDVIICGNGKDEIWINFSIDGDQVSDDCKIIHNGYQAFGYLIFYHIRLTFMI